MISRGRFEFISVVTRSRGTPGRCVVGLQGMVPGDEEVKEMRGKMFGGSSPQS